MPDDPGMPDDPAQPSCDAAGLPGDTATRAFTGHRELLFSVVYNLLGSVSDTEDVLQETWLAWSRRCRRPPAEPGPNAGAEPGAKVLPQPGAKVLPQPGAELLPEPGAELPPQPGADSTAGPAAEPVANPRAYLVRIAVNQALARQAGINRRRETYVGPWLPEPLLTTGPEAWDPARAEPAVPDVAEAALRTESVSMALLVVLETLSPLERAVFVLHEVFGYAHPEIAEILDRSPSATRQLAHRARGHVQARRPRYQADPRVMRQVTERFIAAALGGELAALLRLLAPEVTMWTDGGGKARSALRPVSGRDRVARFLRGYADSQRPQELDVRYRHVNGDPSAVVFSDDSPYAVLVLDLDAHTDRVTGIYLVTNPDKLSRVRLEAPAAPERGEQEQREHEWRGREQDGGSPE